MSKEERSLLALACGGLATFAALVSPGFELTPRAELLISELDI